jgi:Pex14 N-terminal domain
MTDDKNKIPAWQRISSSKSDDKADNKSELTQPSAANAAASEDLVFTKEVDQMPPVPTREEAAKFLEHPGTKNATLDDKIRFLEVKGVRQEDIEALIPEAKSNHTNSVLSPSWERRA